MRFLRDIAEQLATVAHTADQPSHDWAASGSDVGLHGDRKWDAGPIGRHPAPCS